MPFLCVPRLKESKTMSFCLQTLKTNHGSGSLGPFTLFLESIWMVELLASSCFKNSTLPLKKSGSQSLAPVSGLVSIRVFWSFNKITGKDFWFMECEAD